MKRLITLLFLTLASSLQAGALDTFMAWFGPYPVYKDAFYVEKGETKPKKYVRDSVAVKSEKDLEFLAENNDLDTATLSGTSEIIGTHFDHLTKMATVRDARNSAFTHAQNTSGNCTSTDEYTNELVCRDPSHLVQESSDTKDSEFFYTESANADRSFVSSEYFLSLKFPYFKKQRTNLNEKALDHPYLANTIFYGLLATTLTSIAAVSRVIYNKFVNQTDENVEPLHIEEEETVVEETKKLLNK